MSTQIDLNKKVADTLNSLDGIQRAEPTPFFYTRLMGRMQASPKSSWEAAGSLLAQPVIALAGLALILSLNGFLLFGRSEDPVAPVQEKEAAVTNTVTDNEYILASNSSFDYENLDQ